jgi:transcriptional regulator with XRE-family HTH domain
MPCDLKILGAVIRQERKQRGLSQEGLAALSGLSRAFVGEIERGEVNVSFSTLTALADGLNVPLAMVVAEYERSARSGAGGD